MAATFDSSYYDLHPTVALSSITSPLRVPLLAVDRPGYGGSTPLAPLKDGQTFNQETARLMHSVIVPALWNHFAQKAGASTIVLHTHSIGSFIGVMVAAMHASSLAASSSPSSPPPAYPLAGLAIAGIGPQYKQNNEELIAVITAATPNAAGTAHTWPADLKNDIMLRPELNLTSPEIYALARNLNAPFPDDERDDTVGMWPGYWKEYAREVRVPVYYGLPQFDCLWETEVERVEEFASAFEASKGVTGGMIWGAPHCVDLSKQGRGWAARCVGFAMECAITEGLDKEKAKE